MWHAFELKRPFAILIDVFASKSLGIIVSVVVELTILTVLFNEWLCFSRGLWLSNTLYMFVSALEKLTLLRLDELLDSVIAIGTTLQLLDFSLIFYLAISGIDRHRQKGDGQGIAKFHNDDFLCIENFNI